MSRYNLVDINLCQRRNPLLTFPISTQEFLVAEEVLRVSGVNINQASVHDHNEHDYEDLTRMAIDTNVTAPVNKKFFYLTTLNLARLLNETAPQVEPPAEGQPSNAQAVQAVEAWKHSGFLCHNYVLNGLVDDLYNVYCKTTTAKELWESLECKYKTEGAGTKKFMVACFLDYKMVDSKNVITQVQDLQVLLHDIHAEGMTVSEAFQVVAIIEKLRPSWVDFKNYLKHKRKEMSVEDLIVHLRIEEDNKLA
ncbi:pol polyprotein [Tanacetum coccineum]